MKRLDSLEASYRCLWWGFWLFIILVAVGWLTSCTTTKVVTVEKVKTDTTYITKQQRDSIWLHDSIHVMERGDTIKIEKWHTKYIDPEELSLSEMKPKVNYKPSDDISSAVRGASLAWATAKDEAEGTETPEDDDNVSGGEGGNGGNGSQDTGGGLEP